MRAGVISRRPSFNFSDVSNIDQRRIGVLGKTGSIAVRIRQLSATERSVMLPPNTGKHRALISTILDHH